MPKTSKSEPKTVHALKAAPYNPRTITEEQLQRLEESMEEFGDLSGIVFNRRSGQLIGGHQRVKHLPRNAEIQIERRYEEPTKTGTVAEGFILLSGERWQYREVDVSSVRERQMNVAANKQGGVFDDRLLAALSVELSAEGGLDLPLMGFDEEEHAKLLAQEGMELVGAQTFDMGYGGDGTGFASDPQFGEASEHIFEFIVPADREDVEEVKTRIRDLSEELQITYRLRTVRR